MAGYRRGTEVEWDWGNGTVKGTVSERFTSKVTCTLKGSDVTHNASEDDPTYLIEQDDGDKVLKGGSELRRAS